MTKKTALLILVIGCILAIYNFRTPQTIATETQESLAEEVSIVEEALVPRAPQAQIAAPSFSTSTLQKVSTLKDILKSKNDNDPRMDTDLKNLSDEDKDALVNVYKDLTPESLNDKGTIVFLIGREMTRPEDAEFLKNVLSEEPCLSFDNCGVTNAEKDPHLDSVNNVTLNYPQVVAINRIKTYVETHDLQTVNPSILSHLTDAARIGANSNVSMVKSRSQELAASLNRKLK